MWYYVRNSSRVSRAQKISTVVDLYFLGHCSQVSRAQKISTVVDTLAVTSSDVGFTRSKNFYCCRCQFDVIPVVALQYSKPYM